jgi:hypothetical protein
MISTRSFGRIDSANMLAKLRIAFSVVCGIVCLLLIVLWVRRFSRDDDCRITLPATHAFTIHSMRGLVLVQVYKSNPEDGWHWTTTMLGHDPEGWSNFDSNVRAWHWVPMGGSPQPFAIPHWFLIVLSTALAVTPWVHWSKQFSLRTLLVATTLVAVVLGAVVYSLR